MGRLIVNSPIAWPTAMNTILATDLGAVLANAEEPSAGGSAFSLILLLAVPFAMYFFMIRPQRRRAREQQELQAALDVGDEVITTSGVYGTITGEDGPTRFWLEIDDDVQIRIARAAIQGRVNESADDPADSDDTDDDVDADSSASTD